ncbi:MAG: hypothetical protein HQ593_00885 [Candidatus Omnitrophica bacterium]|nr:hypothetical protein [Candidatus Omnitrophota bacterium]
MDTIKTKSIRSIENMMEGVDVSTLRHRALQNAKSFKASWIDLGQILYTIYNDKSYKEWGYSTFEVYAAKEIGIRKQTALKLLRSYYFLEKKEPSYLKKKYTEDSDTASIPTYESVDLLRLASKKKDLGEADYASIRKSVLEKGKDAKDVKKDLTTLIRRREEFGPQEARQKKRETLLKRFLSTLRSIRDEIRISKVFSAKVLKDTDKLITELESEI